MKIGDKRFLLSTVEDVREALKIYQDLFETTRTGTEQRTLNFYHELVKTKETWYLSEITHQYNLTHAKKLSSGRIGEILKRLDEIGYVDIDKDAEDKRINIYRPLVKEEEKSRISSILEIETLLNSKMEEGLEAWKKNYLERNPLLLLQKFFRRQMGRTGNLYRGGLQNRFRRTFRRKFFFITKGG